MKKHFIFWLIIILADLVILGGVAQHANASRVEQFSGVNLARNDQQVVQTPNPTAPPSYPINATVESRQLPAVGSNAGLVLGASVLVLIIIGGVLSFRRRIKH